eukprot:COSAG02_NODE_15720_length_1146_cov_1.742120_1_plen_180_part_00
MLPSSHGAGLRPQQGTVRWEWKWAINFGRYRTSPRSRTSHPGDGLATRPLAPVPRNKRSVLPLPCSPARVPGISTRAGLQPQLALHDRRRLVPPLLPTALASPPLRIVGGVCPCHVLAAIVPRCRSLRQLPRVRLVRPSHFGPAQARSHPPGRTDKPLASPRSGSPPPREFPNIAACTT